MQARFLAAAAAAIPQNPVIVNEQDVRNELFVAFVVFGFAPVQVYEAGRGGYNGQVFLDFEAEALKKADLFKQFSFKTKDSFFCCHVFVSIQYAPASER